MNSSKSPIVAVPDIGGPIEFKNYFIGFFDILGQREHLARMGSIPGTREEEKEFFDRATATLGAIHAFRSIFNEYFDNYLHASVPDFVTALPPKEQQRVLETCDVEMSFQGFSDTLIVYLPAINRHGRYQWRGIHALFAACATLMPSLMKSGIPVRGALDVGVGVEFVQGEIYGPVLQHAYYLESRVAGYPRIVVGDALVKHFAENAATRDMAEQKGISGEDYDKHASWLGIDDDGVKIVDYLGTSARAMLGGYAAELIPDAHTFICAECDRFRQDENGKLSERYERLKRYYETRCPDLMGTEHTDR